MPPEHEADLAIVVEDDEELREMIRELLEMAGFQTVGCPDGTEGIKAIRDLHPSVVTLDLHMPGMDGVEVLDRLAGDEETAGIPVVIVSAYSSDRRLRSHAQVKAIVQKPFDVDQLCRVVSKAADRADPTPRELRAALINRFAV